MNNHIMNKETEIRYKNGLKLMIDKPRYFSDRGKYVKIYYICPIENVMKDDYFVYDEIAYINEGGMMTIL